MCWKELKTIWKQLTKNFLVNSNHAKVYIRRGISARMTAIKVEIPVDKLTAAKGHRKNIKHIEDFIVGGVAASLHMSAFGYTDLYAKNMQVINHFATKFYEGKLFTWNESSLTKVYQPLKSPGKLSVPEQTSNPILPGHEICAYVLKNFQ